MSVLAHLALLGAWVYAHAPAERAASVGQKRGSLSVRLVPRMLTTTAPISQPATPRPAPPKPIRHALIAPDTPKPTPRTTPAPVMAAGTPTPPAPAAPAGASFANLFAPIISRPIGHGRWGAAPPPIPSAPDMAMQREQAIQATRQAVSERLAQLQGRLNEHPLAGPCAIRIDMDHRQSEVHCAAPQEQALVWSYLGSILQAGAVTTDNSTRCLTMTARDMAWTPCAIDAIPNATTNSGP